MHSMDQRRAFLMVLFVSGSLGLIQNNMVKKSRQSEMNVATEVITTVYTTLNLAKEPKASTYYVVEHSFHVGMYEAWFEKILSPDSPASNASAWTELQAQHGVWNPLWGPTKGWPMFCIWEVRDGVSAKALQDFLDKYVGLGMVSSKVMQIAPGGTSPPTPSIFASPDAVTAASHFATQRASYKEDASCITYYFVEHTFHWGKSQDWWTWLETIQPSQHEHLISTGKEIGIFNTIFMPIMHNPDNPMTLMYCLWEVRAGTSGEALQNFLDTNSSHGVMNSRVMQILSEKWMGPPQKSQFDC